MPSKLVTDREKSARAVAAAAETHAAAIAAGMTRELTAHLRNGESMPDSALLVRLIGRKLLADSAALTRADSAHEKELADDAGPRDDRDAAVMKTRSLLVDLRAAVDATYGERGLALLSLADAIPVDPSVLATTAGNVLHALNDASLKLPKPRRTGLKLDRSAFADDLAEELPVLQKALAKVAKEDREKESTQRAKNEAMTTNDATFANGAGWLAASCQLAGLGDIAAKVRPSGRRPGQTAEGDDSTTGAPPGGAAPAGGG